MVRELIERQESDRRRIAAELHDGLGQQLLLVHNRTLLALRSQDMGPVVRGELEKIGELVKSSLAAVREIAHGLAPHQLEHLGLSAALEALVEAVAETEDFRLEGMVYEIDGLLPKAGEIALYRIVQESLTNILRHANAKNAALHVRYAGKEIRLTVMDDGCGFDAGASPAARGRSGIGLAGIAERVRILRGRFRVVTAPGRGTRLEVALPVAAWLRRDNARAVIVCS
jgi:two-component system, sensor histidine kinase LadS